MWNGLWCWISIWEIKSASFDGSSERSKGFDTRSDINSLGSEVEEENEDIERKWSKLNILRDCIKRSAIERLGNEASYNAIWYRVSC